MTRWQLETAEQREHRLTQRRQCCPQEQRNRSLEYQGQYQGLPSVIETERLHFRSQNISVRHGSYRSGKSVFNCNLFHYGAGTMSDQAYAFWELRNWSPNITCLWAFHTYSLLQGHMFLACTPKNNIHLHYLRFASFLKIQCYWRPPIQCSWLMFIFIIVMMHILNDNATCNFYCCYRPFNSCQDNNVQKAVQKVCRCWITIHSFPPITSI